MSEPDLCAFVTYRATLETPEEQCEWEVVDGEEYCQYHLDD